MLVGDFKAQIGQKCFGDFLFQHELATKTQISLLALILFWQIAQYVFTKATVYLLVCRTTLN